MTPRSITKVLLVLLALCIVQTTGCVPANNTVSTARLPVTSEGNIDKGLWTQALQWGSIEEVREMLDQGADPDVIFDNGESGLHIAVEQGNLALVKLLLAYGGDVNIQEREEGFTALMYASLRDDLQMIEVLIYQGADPNIADLDGYTVYDYLGYHGNGPSGQLIAAGLLPPAGGASRWKQAAEAAPLLPDVPTMSMTVASGTEHAGEERR